MRKHVFLLVSVAALFTAPAALSHLDSDNFHLSYRQSVFAVLAANFGPMTSMIKGERPWDGKAFVGYAEDLNNAAKLNVMRGFAPGTSGGKTRAKPAVWKNQDDVNAKWEDLRTASAALLAASKGDDRAAIVDAFKKTGGTCKACHDDYKTKEYLN